MNKLSSISKKYIVLASIFCSLFIFGHQVIAQNDPTVVVPPVITTDPTPVIGSYKGNCNPTTDENCYQFLEALPTSEGDLTSVNTSATGKEGKGLGGFITFAFEIGVGVAGVLGVVMLTIYGFQYAANDKNIATFEVLKDRITKIILGLLLLLSIFIILRTINPDLLILEPEIAKVGLEIEATIDNTIKGESVDDFKNNTQIPNSGKGFALNGTFESPKPSPTSTNLLQANQALKSGQAKITKLYADVGTGSDTNGKMYIYLSNGMIATVPIRTGWKGVAERGEGKSGDHKTPKGDWKIMQRMSISSGTNNAVVSNNGKSNFGPAFLNYTPRATGLHGRGDNTLGTTEGCLRLYNDDLLLLAPFIYKGLDLKID